MKKVILISVFVFLITFVTAAINVAEDNPDVNGVNIFPEEPRILIGNLTQNINITNINQTITGVGNPFDQELNTTKDVTFDDITSTGIISGFFNWIINLLDGSSAYLTFNGSTLSFNETQLNSTISQIANLSGGGLAGNPFDQILNTTSNVRFANITSIGNLTISGNASFLDSLFVNNFIGIGIINPTFELEVIGSGKFTDDLLVGGDFFTTGIANINLNLLTVGEVAGRVGINTINPQQTLNVVGDGNFTGNLNIGNQLTFWTGGTRVSSIKGALTDGSNFIFDTNNEYEFKADGTIRLKIRGGAGTGEGISVNGTTLLGTATSGGLSAGDLNMSGNLFVQGSGDNFFNGKVGIGTPNPIVKLHIKDGDAGTAIPSSIAELGIESDGHTFISLLSPNTFQNGIYFGDEDSNQIWEVSVNHQTDKMSIKRGASEKFLIDSSGNVGIGILNPTQKLDVDGNAQIKGQLILTNTTTEFSKIYTNANGDTIFT